MRALVLVALVLAGCVAPALDPAATEATPGLAAPTLALLPAVELPTARATHEPSIAVAAAGRVLVAGASPFDPAPLWISRDRGATFEARVPTGLPYGTEGQPAFSPDGDAYVVDDTLAGLVVARSGDGGESWEVAAIHSLAIPGGDRPWIAADAGGRVYVTWNQIPSGQWVAASEDGGRTWPVQTFVGLFTTVTGPLAVAPDGTVFIARPESEGTAVYASRDGARSFSRTLAWPAEGAGGWLFPTPAVDAAGNLYVTTIEQLADGTRARWAVSTDGGASFSPPREATLAPGIHVHAWSAAGPEGRLAMAFYENPTTEATRPDDADGPWHLRLVVVDGAHTDAPAARETRVVEEAVHEGAVCTTGTQDCSGICPPVTRPCVVGREPGEELLGDYLGVAMAPDGVAHVVWQSTLEGDYKVWHARTADEAETVKPEGGQAAAWT